MNFYQSQLRREIQHNIYKKPIFELSIAGQEYFGIVKTQRRLGKELNRYMVHGIQWANLKAWDTSFVTEATRIQRDHNKHRWDIFFQFWFLDPVWEWDTTVLKTDQELVTKLKTNREKQDAWMRDQYQLLPSWREHMPDTTIQIPLDEGIQHIRSWYSKSGKRYINKAKKEDLHFEIAESKDWQKFWEIRYTMSYDKWFAIIPKETFVDLMQYLTDTNTWRLMLAKKGRKIVCGSVVLAHKTGEDKKELIYLYGATSREYGNIWWHYRLTDQILKRWAHEWYETYDMLGVAPPGRDDHYLSWVTRFKQAFGGKTIYSIWNYDSVYNSKLYRAMQVLKWGSAKKLLKK